MLGLNSEWQIPFVCWWINRLHSDKADKGFLLKIRRLICYHTSLRSTKWNGTANELIEIAKEESQEGRWSRMELETTWHNCSNKKWHTVVRKTTDNVSTRQRRVCGVLKWHLNSRKKWTEDSMMRNSRRTFYIYHYCCAAQLYGAPLA